jgi:hypothetical protein
MLKNKKSVLLKTSSASDVVHSGGKVKITGLPELRAKDIISIRKKSFNAEVVQIARVGISGYTPTPGTVYKVHIGDPFSKVEGTRRGTKPYGFTTPAVLTTIGSTAALQREFIHQQIIKRINADKSADVVAASLGTGNGITITDKPNYQPVRPSSKGRRGASLVFVSLNSDGTGFSPAVDLTINTAAVYSFGDGTKMAANAAVINPVNGAHVIKGDLETPKTITGELPVAGQRYNAVFIEATVNATNPGTVAQASLQPAEFVVFVDNGAGTSTANAAGYTAFDGAINNLVTALAL